MTNQVNSKSGNARPRSKALMIATSVFALLYLWFIIFSFIPAPEGSWVSATVPFEPFDREQIFVKLAFLLFVIGYLVVWKNELIGGVIFLLWWGAMWGLAILIVAPAGGPDAGSGVGLGLPVFVLGLLFIRNWYKGRTAGVRSLGSPQA